MKKIILALALLLTITVSRTFAGEDVNQNVLTAFNKKFIDAKNVQWKNVNHIVKATFALDGQTLFAYYKETGEEIAVSRNLASSQLPLNLMSDIKRRYNDFRIADLFEVAAYGETTYYITIEHNDHTTTLKSDGINNWEKYLPSRQ